MNYDFSKWHPTCGDKQLMNCGEGLMIYCPKCGVTANVEAIAGKITPADACKVGVERTPYNKQSPNVDRGEYKA